MQNYQTPEETAQHLRVDLAEIMLLIEQGKLRAIRIGNSVRIPESELENLLVTSSAAPAHTVGFKDSPAQSRLVHTRSGRATFRVAGSIKSGAEIWPGKMLYPIRFPKAFMDALLEKFAGVEVPVGGSFDGPTKGSLGEFIQERINTKMNPAVYLAALLIEEGHAYETRRGFIQFRSI